MSDENTVTITRKWPEAWYVGSTIQQNHGEDRGHGFLVWDTDEDEPEYIELDNPYGFYTIDVENSVLPVRPDVPERPRLRLRIQGTSGVEVRRIIKDVRNIYDPERLSVMRMEDEEDSVPEDEDAASIGDLSSVSYQNSLITDYVSRNFPATDDIVEKIREINGELNKQLDEEDLANNIRWKPKRFEFSNMFSYGEDNAINFEKMNGVIGLFSENATGKSSIFDALCFCLFDKSIRASKTNQVLNNNKEWFECKLRFEIEGTEYIIHRKGEKERGRIPVDVDFYRINDDGTTTSLNGNQRYETNSNIEDYVGAYEDFILSTLSIQNDNTIFIEKSQSARKDILGRFMGIDVFDELYSLAKKEVRDIRVLLEEHDKEELQETIETCKEDIQKKSGKLGGLDRKRESLDERRDEITSEIMELNKKLSDIEDEPNINVEELKAEYVSLKEEVGDLEDKISEKEIKEREINHAIEALESWLDDHEGDELERAYKEQEKTKADISDLETKLRYVKRDLSETVEEKQHLEEHSEFDPECEYCVARNERDKKKLDELVEEIEDLREQKDRMESTIEEKKAQLNPDISDHYETYQHKSNRLQKQENKLSSLQVELSRIESKKKDKQGRIEEIENKVERYNEIKDKIERNDQIQGEINDLDEELTEVKSEMERIDNQFRDLHSEIKMLKERRNQAEDDMEKVRGLSKKFQAYEYYIQSVKKDGIPYEIISKFIPQIEQHVNSILGQIVNFDVMLEMDGKNINAYIVYDEDNFWAVELGSGMEKFVCGLAIRAALMNVSNLPRANFLAIDEGFGNLDSDNMSSVYNLFEFLKSNFDFIVVISHIDVMRDEVDDLMDINVGEQFSSIQY